MVGFANMHESIFRTMSVAGTLMDQDGIITDVDVVLRFGVDEVDIFNEVVGRVDKASFMLSQISPKKSETLVVPSGEFSGTYKLARKVHSNGYVEAREIVRYTD